MSARRGAVLALALALAAAACGRKAPDREVPDSVVVLEASLTIKTGPIGLIDKKPATYVLVDAENRSAEARLVSLEGALLDDGGGEVAPLPVVELYIPAGEKRAFALASNRVAPEATRARVKVHGAPVEKHPPGAVIVEPNVGKQPDGRLFAAPLVKNTLAQPLAATVIVAFYDDAGKLLARPWDPVPLAAGETRAVKMVGPEGATRAQVFVGEIAY